MSFKQKHPNQLIGRCLVLEDLRKYSGEQIYKHSRNMAYKFKDEAEEGYEIDWEYCIFDAPDYELQRVITELQAVAQRAKYKIADSLTPDQNKILDEAIKEEIKEQTKEK